MAQIAVAPAWESHDAHGKQDYAKDLERSSLEAKPELDGKLNDTDSTESQDEIVTRFSIIKKLRELEIVSKVCKDWRFQAGLLCTAVVCGFSYNLDNVLRSTYTGYATNSFSQHSLLATINVINSVVSVAAQLFFARLSDHFGRLQLFGCGTVFYIVGTILQSQSKNVSVYAAGAVFYNAGLIGVRLLLTIMISDFSTMSWRYFMISAPDWCFIIITWVSGNIVDAANPLVHWSWDIGMWAFIFPLTTIPLITYLLFVFYKASRTSEWKELRAATQKIGYRQNITEIFWNLDIPGVLLLTISLGCVLVPLTVAGGEKQKWKDSRNIGVLCLGGVLFPFFLLWEGKLAKKPVLPLSYLKDRGIWAPVAASFFMSNAFLIVTDYLYPVLMVAFNQSESSAQRISYLSSFAGVVVTPFTGILISKWQHLKYLTITGCILFYISFGLLYHYRGGTTNVSGVIAGSVIMGLGSGVSTYPFIVSLQAVSSHSRMAIVTALFYAFEQIGKAVGSAISGAIWTQVMFREISKRLPDEPDVVLVAYATPYDFITMYAWGTPQRAAVVSAYMYVQRILLITALVLLVPLLAMALIMRDTDLSDTEITLKTTDRGNVLITRQEDKVYDTFMNIVSLGTRKKQNAAKEEILTPESKL